MGKLAVASITTLMALAASPVTASAVASGPGEGWGVQGSVSVTNPNGVAYGTDECNGLAFCASPNSLTKASVLLQRDISAANGTTTINSSLSGDLSTGQLKVTRRVLGGENYGSAYAMVSISDKLNFSGIADPTPVTFKIRLDGTMAGDTQTRFIFLASDLATVTSDSRLYVSIPTAGVLNTSNAYYFTDTNTKGTWSHLDSNYLEITRIIDPLHPVITLTMQLQSQGQHDGYTLFGHTAALTLDMPTGVTFTSSSGLFLTNVPSAAPEPATWSLMILGVGGMGAALRTRRRKAVVA